MKYWRLTAAATVIFTISVIITFYVCTFASDFARQVLETFLRLR